VLTGGGTGGHIYPALSVAQCLATDQILYVGSREGPEASIVPRAGVPFRAVPSRKLSRKPTPGALTALGVSGWGVLRAMSLLRSWKPDVILGTGGYASAGIMFAAALLRLPAVIHEANVVPGRVNRLLARFASRVALTYNASEQYFPAGKTLVTGMPVRRDLLSGNPSRARAEYGLRPDVPTLLVSGGSGGAQTLNRAVTAALHDLNGIPVQIVHQTGKSQYAAVMRDVGSPPSFYHPVAYVDDMPSLLAAATLIVCRAGSSTLAEVTAVGLPAIMVPYPFAVADHQTGNARALANGGGGLMVKDDELTPERLVREVGGLLADRARLEAMRTASRRLGNPRAAQAVADLLRDVATTAKRR
jgi:UDP-N-acetylglucosamine--N-acetylmuramyl-(pentapeptide) pyrophosphoryl-undecaprenol N-acetylglucosamine transferase